MTKEDVFKAIIDWQMDAGEDFLDYFDGNVTETSFMFWCLGKGYISQEKFNVWEKMYSKSAIGNGLNEYLYNYYDEDNGFSIVHSEDWEEEKQGEAYMILAEFIASSETYRHRLKEFLEEYED